MAAAEVDLAYVSGHLGLDPSILVTLTSGPTVDLVLTLLQAVALKAHEFDDLYANKLQIAIELENAVRSSETRSQTYKSTAENALKEVEQARQKLKDEETKRQHLENEVQTLTTKSSDRAAEVKALNDRVEALQSSNRANLAIIESNNKRDQTVAEELAKQHQRNVELAREVTALQQSDQNAKGQLNSAKYREESLKQQLELATRNGEWLENELKTKSEEALRYRKEKGARVAELQRESEDARSEIDSLRRTEQQLRERLDSMQVKAEEALVQKQKQESSFASTVESYKQELEDQRRLVDMSDQLSKKHQERVRELEADKERLKDNYENEIRRVRLELEQERRMVTEMEEKIGRLEGELTELQARRTQGLQSDSAPQTPRPNGSAAGRAASPFGTPASIRSKSAVTATQAIEQLYQVKGQLAAERRRNQQLSEELDGMISALEAKAPELQELRSESEFLSNELARMSELSQQSFEERDAARKAARKAEGALANSQSEVKILRTQLRDLGTQIQMLVFNMYALEKGVDQLTEEEKFRLGQLEKGEVTEEALSDMSDTHQFITQKLVVFKDIQSLQAKNEDLLRITRELAEQMESEEALAAKHQAKEDHDRVEKLQQELEHMAEESRSIKHTMESYKTERDMFRRILQQRGSGGDEASMMRSSLDGSSQRPPLASLELGDQIETLNEALRRLQSEYDAFRDAHDGVRKDLRDQLDRLYADKNSFQTERVKLLGDLRLESERREMLQNNFVALQAENSELQKRNQIYSETAAKQDIRTQQVAEELIEARGLIDSMRNEAANLKAEKKLWKDIQDRMSKDNENLIEEKNRLNHLLATQQSLENERNMAEAEARRKAQAKIETLEHELSEVQRKLSNEAEESKRLQLRKEFEAKESQKRIDELMASLSQIREEHVEIKTTRDHLQARVDELSVELRNAEGRVARLQPRPTPRPDSVAAEGSNQVQQELENELRDLQNDMADLKRDHDLATTQLENAKAQAEQYKQLSLANEEALEDLRSSQDQYRQEMESLVDEKDSKIKELGQRIEDLSSEMSRSNSELSALRDSQADVARKYEEEKTILEEELNRLKADSDRHLEAARFHQQDLRAQAEIASKAQQDYEQELVKHAEAAKMVQQLRSEHNELKSQVAFLRAEAESAQVALTQGESSWEERRIRLEQEMTELRARREDVNAQNKLLHQQLEGLTAQVTALQHKREGIADSEDGAASGGVGDALEGLRELNSYLRREKEILEVQYDLKSQESKRLQQQLEYVQSQLDEARLKLDQERSQSGQGAPTAAAHKNLMEKLTELNLYRESSAALRNENSYLKDQMADKNKKIEEMEGKIRPLEAEIERLKTEKSYLEEEIKQIQEDRDRWQKRTEGILTKSGRADPTEMESLKKQAETLEAERNSLKEGEGPLRAKLNELESILESERQGWQTTRAKLTEQFKDRSRKLTGEKNELLQRTNQLQEQLDQAQIDVEGSQKQAEEARMELEKQILGFQQQVEQLRQQQTPQELTATPSLPASAEVVAQLEQQLADAGRTLETVTAQKLSAEQQLEALQLELQAAMAERDDALRRLEEASAAAAAAAGASTSGPDMAMLQTPASAETMAEAGGTQVPAAPLELSESERRALEEKVAAAEAKAAEFEEKAKEVEAKIQQTVKERCDRMRDALNSKLKESRTRMEEDFKQKNEDLKLRFDQEKLIWQAENQGGSPAQPPKTPGAEQAASTPSKQGAPAAAGAVAELARLDDASIRQFLASNATVKSIIAANIKKKLEAENAKVKGEMETKIAAAREQAQLMESKKSTLRINMTENKLKTANAKLGVVEAAATQTPTKAVAEVWEMAKKMQASGGPSTPVKVAATAANNNAALAGSTPEVATTSTTPMTTAAATPSDAAATKPAARPSEAAAGVKATMSTPKGGGAARKAPAAAATATGSETTEGGKPTEKALPATSKANSNPFAVPATAAKAETANPFATKTDGGPSLPAHGSLALPEIPPAPLQQQTTQIPRSGIPMPRGGAGRGRGGAYVPPGQRAGAANQGVGRGRGRGGGGGGAGGGANSGTADASGQAGAKRPRGDSEAGRGAKKARGGH